MTFVIKYLSRNGISGNTFKYEYRLQVDILYNHRHKLFMCDVFDEFQEVLLDPDNMEMSKKLGVYSGLNHSW
jgi:hypothetical protein